MISTGKILGCYPKQVRISETPILALHASLDLQVFF
jgi:hypothetical protein